MSVFAISRVPADRGINSPSPEAYAHMAAGVLMLVFGSAASLALQQGFRPSVRALAGVMLVITVWASFGAKVTRLNLLPRLMTFLYALPFSILLGFLFNPRFVWVYTPNGFALGLRPELNSIILLIGICGISGLAAGFHFVAAFSSRRDPVERVNQNTETLGRIMFAAFIVLAVGLSQLSASPETVFQSAYALRNASPKAEAINFPAAFLISYVVFVLLWIDIEREPSRVAKRWKVMGFAAGVGYVIVFLQILRGDRESSGLIAAMVGLYLTAPMRGGKRPSRGIVSRRIRGMLIPLIAMVTLYIALGSAREQLSAASSRISLSTTLEYGLRNNTWTAVLWRNLGLAWEYEEGLIKYKMGSTYKDYMMSLPPGVISKKLGYVRPQEGWQGIAYEDPAGVSAGGLHVVIVPFKNFGAFGVVTILCFFGVLIAMAERAANLLRFFARLLWGALFCASFIWFWYGDMPIIRAIMAAMILAVVYRLATLPHSVFKRQLTIRFS